MKKRKSVRTVTELAKQIGRPIGTVSRWLKRDDSPVQRRGPWSPSAVKRLKAWAAALAANPAHEPDAAAEERQAMRRAQYKKIQAQGELMTWELATKRDEYIRRVDVESQAADKVRAARMALQQVPRALRQKLAECGDAVECEKILTDALREICNAFAAGPG